MRSQADLLLQSKRVTDTSYNLLSTGGGKFLLPTDSDWDALRVAAAKDFESGTPNFLVESKTTTFPFFLDIDFAHPTLGLKFVEGPLLARILRGVADALSPVLPVTHQEVLVAAAPAKQVKGGTKTGVHLHWQWLRLSGGRKLHLACTTDTAVAIRACILRQLAALPVQDPPLNMDDVVDRRVLEKNGCRMLFSGKSLPCDRCLATRKQVGKELPCRRPELDLPTWKCPCPACRDADARIKAGRAEHGCVFGKLQEHRSYSPYKMVRWEEGVVTVRTTYGSTFDAVKALRQTSVRFSGRPPTVVPLKETPRPGTLDAERAGKRQRTGEHSTEGGADEVHGPARQALLGMAQLLLDEDGFAGDGYPFIQSVKLMNGVVLVTGHFHCKIIGRYHHSNRQYFRVRPDGTVTQHCYHEGCRGRSAPCAGQRTDPAWFVPAAQ